MLGWLIEGGTVVDGTGAPPFAADVGIRDRRIAPGLRADLNLIDPVRLSVGPPRLVRDLPAGGKRFLQKGEGYLGTWVAGRRVVRDNLVTDERPGRPVRFGTR